MNKYLILDDGDNIKSYDETLKKYITIGKIPVSIEMFNLYGNTAIYDRNGIVLENPTILYFSNDDKVLKYKLVGIPVPQIIKFKQNFHIPEKGIKRIIADYIVDGNSDIKIAIYDGTSYYGFKEFWEKISDINDINEFLNKGISVKDIHLLTKDNYSYLLNSQNQSISFACVLYQESLAYNCKIKKINIEYLY